MNSLFLSGVDMEEVVAALTPVEKLVTEETPVTLSPIRETAKEKLMLSTKHAKERKPILRSAPNSAVMTAEEKAEAMLKLESHNMNNLVSMLRPVQRVENKDDVINPKSTIRERMFDKNGEPLDQQSVVNSLHEVQSKFLPKIILTGRNIEAKIEEKRGSAYFLDDESPGSLLTSNTVDARNYYGIEARQKLFQHYRNMSRQRFNYSGNESLEPPESVSELSSIYCATRQKEDSMVGDERDDPRDRTNSMATSLSSPSLSLFTKKSKTMRKTGGSVSSFASASTSTYAGLRLRNERKSLQHPLESTFLPKFDVFAGVDEQLIKHSRHNYFSYKCLAQKVYDDDDDDDTDDDKKDVDEDAGDEGSNGDDKSVLSQMKPFKDTSASMSMKLKSTSSKISASFPAPGLESSVSQVTHALTMQDEANIMNSPRTKYIGGCIREKLQPLPRLVCRIDRNCRSIDVSSYGFGDAST